MLFDFTSVQQRIVQGLAAKSSWADILYYSTNQRLIDAIAQEISNLAQYDEYLTRETKWSQAQNTSSLLLQATLLNYKPNRKIGSVGTQQRFSTSQTFNASYSVIVDIPKYTVFSDGGDIKVSTTSSNSLLVGANYIDLDVIQGTPVTTNFVVQGLNYEEIDVIDSTIENSNYEVYVNNVLWTEISDIRLATSGTQQVFQVINKPDFSGIILKFGNNIFGQKLSSGDAVKFVYISTLGASGNILASGIITTVESTIYDINGHTVQGYCSNIGPIEGGQDAETAESIRTNGNQAFQTGDRATAEQDYVYLLKTQPIVFKTIVWGEYEKGLDDPSYTPGSYIAPSENMVYICAIDNTGSTISLASQTSIRAFLNTIKSPTDIPSFVDVEMIYMIFNITAYVSDRSYTLSQVKSNILTAVENQYGLAGMDFHVNVDYSDYTTYIDSIAGVDHHDTTATLFNKFSFQTGQYICSFTLSLFPFDANSVSIWVRSHSDTGLGLAGWVEVATDDGAGNLVSVSPYVVLNTSSINYSTGAGTLTLTDATSLPHYATSSPTDYDVKIIYTLTDRNFQLKQRWQYIQYSSEDLVVTTQYTT